jgi:glycosyltransferase involved in cell wall biosynthesis
MKISVCMITMNEEQAVGKVIDDIRRYVPDAEIVICDSSKDKTPEIATAKGATVIRQFPPQGYGKAMDAALRAATGDVLVTLDCDDTYPADQIPVLVDYIVRDGYDLVDASRLKTKPAAMPMLNYLANTGFAWIASLLFFKRFTDLHSGMRAYRKNVIENIHFDTRGHAQPVDLLLRPLKQGYRIKFAFIDYHERIGASTMRPLGSAWWTIKRIILARFSR